MLLNFKVKNFLSYKDLTSLSMMAGSTKLKSERIEKFNDFSILKFSAIYGANASGKSNLISAIDFMRNMVLVGIPNFIQHAYYKLDKKYKNENSYFEVELTLNNKIYAYGFEFLFSKNVITSEWFYELGKEEKIMYTRDVAKGIYNLNLELSADLMNKFNVYFDDLKTDGDLLFLTTLLKNKSLSEENEVKLFFNLLNWFKTSLKITEPTSILTSGKYMLIEEKMNKLSELLCKFDTGISKMVTVDILEEEIRKHLPKQVLESIQNDLTRRKSSSSVASLLRVENTFWIIHYSKPNNTFNYKKACFYHNDNYDVMFDFDEESDGTIRILDLAEILLTDETNKVYFIDELDRCLHPQLTCQFIKEFLEHAKKSNNQLIVTTHESRLLDFDILRRDEIWFADKKNGETSLYSLEEFSERFDKKIDKAYLDGRYGGIPILNSIFLVDSDENFG